MRMRAAGFALLFLGCTVDLQDDANYRLTCDDNSDCPGAYECFASLGLCVRSQDDLPVVTVALTLPRQGDVEVSLSPTLVVAFNMDATLPTTEHISLAAEGHAPPLTISETGIANTFIVEPGERLLPLSEYTLTVGPGIAPAVDVVALPSNTVLAVAFTTTSATDIAPPGVVQDFVVERDSPADNALHELSWSKPADIDVFGTVILRSLAPITADLEQGRIYAAGQVLGDLTVVYVGVDEAVNDTPPGAGPFRYAAYAFDNALNYSPLVSPPIATVTDRRWCPDATGRFRLTSTDDGLGQLQIANVVNAPWGSGTLYPTSGIAFNVDHDIVGTSPFVVGQQLQVRPVATNADATYMGPGLPWWLSSAELSLQTPPPKELDEIVQASFSPQDWPAFEGQLDIDPAASQENFVSATTGANSVSALTTLRGVFRFRARPVVPQCADSAWSSSAEFTVAGAVFLYVTAGGAGTGDALTAANASATITAALPKASSGTTILVTAGTYDENVQLKRGVAIEGGYSPDFSSRDPTTYVSTISSASSPVVFANVATLNPASVLDGFTLTATTESEIDPVVAITNGASPTLSNNIVNGSYYAWYSAGISSMGDGSPTFINNVVDASIAISVLGGAPTVQGNSVHGDSYQRGVINCEGEAAPTIRGNVIRHRNRATKTNASGIKIIGMCDAVITENQIEGPGAPDDDALTAMGIHLLGGSAFIANNLIFSGNGAQTFGVVVDQPYATASTGSVTLVNNTILVGTSTGNYFDGVGSAGVELGANLNFPIVYDVRIANNLLLGPADWFPFVISNTFDHPTVIQNNKALAAGVDAFLFTHSVDPPAHPMPGTRSTVAEAEAALCAADLTFAGNALVVADAVDVFTSFAGGDANPETLADNVWSLGSSVPTAIEEGGLTLGAGDNCGSASCVSISPNQSCGVVDEDHEGATRDAPYAVGAFE